MALRFNITPLHSVKEPESRTSREISRMNLSTEVNGLAKMTDFNTFLGLAGLRQLYDEFLVTNGGDINLLYTETINYIQQSRSTWAQQQNPHGTEAQLIDFVRPVLQRIVDVHNDHNDHKYHLEDHQVSPIHSLLLLKPDLILTYEQSPESRSPGRNREVSGWGAVHFPIKFKAGLHTKLDSSDAAQLGDYARECFVGQISRTMVPLLFIRHLLVDIIAFYGNRIYRFTIGKIQLSRIHVRRPQNRGHIDHQQLHDFISFFLFLLSLEPLGFTHLAEPIPHGESFNFQVDRVTGISHIKTFRTPRTSNRGITIRARVRADRPWFFSRITRVYDATFQNKRYFLKVSCNRLHQISEGLVYQCLMLRNIPGVPEIVSSGILEHDIDGGHWDYLLTREAGITADQFFQPVRNLADVSMGIVQVLQQVGTTLIELARNGAWHRNVSPQNILIQQPDGNQGQRVRLCGWSALHVFNRNFLADSDMGTWGVAADELMHVGDVPSYERSSLEFASFSDLRSLAQRATFSDLESLFFSCLKLLNYADAAIGENITQGFNSTGNISTIVTRAHSIQSDENLVHAFSLERYRGTVALVWILRFRRALFTDDNGNSTVQTQTYPGAAIPGDQQLPIQVQWFGQLGDALAGELGGALPGMAADDIAIAREPIFPQDLLDIL